MAVPLTQFNKAVKGADQWAYTSVDVIECRYVWGVNNPGHLSEDLISPVFAAKQNVYNAKWQLILKWHSEGQYANLRLCLKLVSAPDKSVYFKWRAFVIDCNEKMRFQIIRPYCTLQPGETDHDNLGINKHTLQSVPNFLITNDTLTIVVNITMRACSQQQSRTVTTKTTNCLLIDDLLKLFNNSEFSDVTIVVGHSKIPVHKSILASRSDVFAAMFRHDLEERKTNQIIIDDFDYNVVREMLRYIYTGQTSEISHMGAELLTAADKYAVTGLKKACIRELNSNLKIETAVNVLISADLHSLYDLKQQAIDFINIYSRDIVKTDAFREMVKNYPDLVLDIFKR